jgi:predicted membrane metal-binding protein
VERPITCTTRLCQLNHCSICCLRIDCNIIRSCRTGGGGGGDWLYAFICKPVFQNCSGIFWNIIIYLYFSFFFLVDGSSMNSKWNLGNVIRWSMICSKILCICKSSIIVGGVSLSTFRILIDCIWIVDSNEKTLITPCSRVFGLDGS